MDMNARNQYLKVLQEKYFMAKSLKEETKSADNTYFQKILNVLIMLLATISSKFEFTKADTLLCWMC